MLTNAFKELFLREELKKLKKKKKKRKEKYLRAKDSQWNYTGNNHILKGFWTLCLNKEKC